MTMVGVEFICPVELVSLSARRMHAWGLLSASVGKEEKPLTRLHIDIQLSLKPERTTIMKSTAIKIYDWFVCLGVFLFSVFV